MQIIFKLDIPQYKLTKTYFKNISEKINEKF
jgi:hypothetical protein